MSYNLSDLTTNILILSTLLALTLTFAFYLKGAFRKRVQHRASGLPKPTETEFAKIISYLTGSHDISGRVIGFWDKPEDIYAKRFEAIQAAKETIDFETFLITPGERANTFAEILKMKAQEGIKVRLIFDQFGCSGMPKSYWKELEDSGVEIVFFNPFSWLAPLDFEKRTHRKLLIIDSKVSFIGATGISDMWDGKSRSDDHEPWLDIEIQLSGPIVTLISSVFMQHWSSGGKKAEISKTCSTETERDSSPMIVTCGSNPNYRYSPIRSLKLNLVSCAQKEILLASPYFLPDENAQKLLIEAQTRGVAIKILTTSKRSDKKPVYYASFEHYGNLLKSGIEIFEYQPSMNHAKMMIVDNTWAVTGSANFDPRSFDHNEEIDIMSSQHDFVLNMRKVFEQGFQKSKRIELEAWRNRSWWRHRLIGKIVNFVKWQL